MNPSAACAIMACCSIFLFYFRTIMMSFTLSVFVNPGYHFSKSTRPLFPAIIQITTADLILFKAEWPTALILHVQDDDNIRYVSSHVNHIVYKLTEYMHMPCHAEKNTLVLKLICNKEMYEYKSSNRSIML